MRFYFILTLHVVFIPFGFAQKNKAVFFAANVPEIVYAGRIDVDDNKKPSFCHSGASIKTLFIGSSIQMILEDFSEGGERFTNYYTIIIDNKVVQTLEVQPGKHTYDLVSGLSKERHSVEIFKRTECMVGKSTFHGFKAPEGTTLEKPIVKSHRIEFIGDSFTCGYGNEASIPAPPEGNPNTGFHSKNENHYLSFSAIVSRKLNTEYRCIAYSGRGMHRNNSGNDEGTLPKLYERVFPDDASSPLADLKKEIPDVIVIKLGANDFFPESRGDLLDDVAFTQTFLTFVEKLRGYYPQAKIICLTGGSMSDTWPEGRNCLTRIQQDVQKVVESRKKAGDDQVYYFKLDQQTAPYGEDWHASIATHQRMAEQLTPFIKQITGW
ncbi:MAG: acetylxylan esterase-related protein carbohydrate esterase family 2 protein [Cytophagaceae bacterium]|jgi:lysophospholipase L1-like esterase|nr:acetylxylan esterase-related protein carbohydrate esterase family 2 protein [Cytophagaceae bacterium]